MAGFFQVAVEYSNAVLMAMLPHVNDAAQSLDLSLPRPVTTNHVRQFRCDPREGHLGGVLFLKSNFTFWFDRGIVWGVESPHCYFHLQEPEEIPRYYGRLNCTQEEAVDIALRAIAGLGHDVAKLKAAKPQVEAPPKIGTNIVPHFRITWPGTAGFSGPAAEVEVNGEKRCIEMLWLYGHEFSRSPPAISVVRSTPSKHTNALSGGIRLTPVSTARREEILRTILPEMAAYAKRLKLPVPGKITTNHLQDIQCGLLNGEPHLQIILTNGYRLSHTWGYVSSFYSPDCFFTYDWKERGKKADDFLGTLPARLEPLESLARQSLKATEYFKDTRFLDQKPILAGGPDMANKVDLTRFLFYWHLPGRLSEAEKKQLPVELWPTAVVEVDSKTMTVQSVCIIDSKQ